jgi:hypothetical protein
VYLFLAWDSPENASIRLASVFVPFSSFAIGLASVSLLGSAAKQIAHFGTLPLLGFCCRTDTNLPLAPDGWETSLYSRFPNLRS